MGWSFRVRVWVRETPLWFSRVSESSPRRDVTWPPAEKRSRSPVSVAGRQTFPPWSLLGHVSVSRGLRSRQASGCSFFFCFLLMCLWNHVSVSLPHCPHVSASVHLHKTSPEGSEGSWFLEHLYTYEENITRFILILFTDFSTYLFFILNCTFFPPFFNFLLSLPRFPRFL